MEAWWFSRIVAHHPYVILLTIFLFSCTCLIAPRTIQNFPDFSDPQLVRISNLYLYNYIYILYL